MLNWIVWNGTVFDVETVLTLKWIVSFRIVLTFNCVQTKSVPILNWISWIRTAWLNWIARNRNVFHIKLYLHLNWVLIVWNRTILIKMDLALNNLERLKCHKTQPTNQQIYFKWTCVRYCHNGLDLSTLV